MNPELLHDNPGTPFDQDSPSVYIPPFRYVRAEDIQDLAIPVADNHESPLVETRPDRKHGSFLKVAPPILAGLLIGTLLNYPKQAAEKVADPSTAALSPEMFTPKTCPKVEMVVPNLETARVNVARMLFGVDGYRFDELAPQINDAQTNQDIERILAGVFEPYDIRVYVSRLPDDNIATATQAPPIEHDVSDLDIATVRASSILLLEELSVTPAKLLHKAGGMDLYLSTQMSLNGNGFGGLYQHNTPNNRPRMYVGIGLEDTRDTFQHEFSHRLLWAMCGENIAGNDSEYAAINPAGFLYTKLMPGQFEARKEKIVDHPYGASNAVEDAATTSLRLNRSGFASCSNELSDKPICKKSMLIAERQAAVEPDIASYYLFRAQMRDYTFPRKQAQDSP